MTRRAWWLVVLNVLIPGSAQVVAGNRRLGRFGLATTLIWWLLVIAAVLIALLKREWLLVVATQPIALAAVVAVLGFYAIIWIVLSLDTLRLVRLVRVTPAARVPVAIVAIAALLATSGGASYAAASGVTAIGVLGEVFAARAQLAEPVDGRYNILLLGGDAGEDRLGLRPDSITVASVDAETGAIVLLGVPRNLGVTEFTADSPMRQLYPDGYDCGRDCLISYLYTYGEENAELYPDAVAAGSSPGIEAMRDGVEGTLGITISYYVLVDMHGFEELIDALGGIDIDVAERLALGANNYDDGRPAPPIGYIEAGPQHMDGKTALWYARSRYNTTDYDRMARQRQVQEAMIAQLDPLTVLTRFQAIARAGSQMASTDIPQNMLAHFAQLALDSREHPIERQDFVPPEFDADNPDIPAIRARVAELLAPAPAE